MNVVWRDRARRDVESAFTYISRESSSGAHRIRSQILHSVEFLAEWPEMARAGRDGFRELAVPHTRYIVIYRIAAESILIHRVMHASQRR